MPKQYALDIVYKSDVTPNSTPADVNNPIAMSYGFVLLGSQNINRGEKVDLSIHNGDAVTFSVFDMAQNPASIASIVVTCADVTNPRNPIAQQSPFGWTNGTYTSNNPVFTDPYGRSTGCNMAGLHGLSLTIATATLQGNNTKTYDITVTVTLTDGTVFQVDPEIDVEAAG